jgi:chemotaxis protein histidine kinase CheA
MRPFRVERGPNLSVGIGAVQKSVIGLGGELEVSSVPHACTVFEIVLPSVHAV